MKQIYIGGDTSKGYTDFYFVDQEGEVVAESDTLDDTQEGHQKLIRILDQIMERFGEVKFHVGFESSGDLERNWLATCKDLQEELNLTSYRINPKIIRRFKEWDLHPISTDEISAKAIADYLRCGLRPQQTPFDPELEGTRTRARMLVKKIDHYRELKNEFQSLLVTVHPDLVQYCRHGIPKWVLKVVKQFPTVEDLASASREELVEIPFVTREKAESLLEEASSSVAGRRDPDTGITMKYLAEDTLDLKNKIDKRKEEIYERVKHLPGVQIMQSIPGIAEWSAAALRLEIGEIFQYADPESLVAQNGLDPVFDDSGDSRKNKGISKQGNPRVRAILFPCIQSAVQNNPPIKSFYEKLRGKGKEHMVAMVACMRKMLHIIYGCWTKKEEFDPGFEKHLKKRMKENQEDPDSSGQKQQEEDLDLSAPISRKEAKRRKELIVEKKENGDTLPQESVSSRKRGPGVPDSK